jgi:hypothetical protein
MVWKSRGYSFADVFFGSSPFIRLFWVSCRDEDLHSVRGRQRS